MNRREAIIWLEELIEDSFGSETDAAIDGREALELAILILRQQGGEGR